jgi:hypothetical protein
LAANSQGNSGGPTYLHVANQVSNLYSPMRCRMAIERSPRRADGNDGRDRLVVGWFSFTCCEDSTILFTELLNDHLEEWKKVVEFSSQEQELARRARRGLRGGGYLLRLPGGGGATDSGEREVCGCHRGLRPYRKSIASSNLSATSIAFLSSGTSLLPKT